MTKANDQEQLKKAYSLHQGGKLNDAARLYRQLIQENPNNFHALHLLGIIEAGAGNTQQAKALMARSLSAQPPNIEFTENYAALLAQMGDYKAALEISRQKIQINASAPLLYIGAISLFKLNQLQESRIQFDRLLSLQPHNVIALNERGSVLAAMKEYEAALASINKALDLNPQYAEAFLNKANLYSELKRYDEALTAFGRALALKPDLAEAWLGYGNVFREVGRYDDAFSAYDKALALKPHLAEGWLGRGNAFTKLARHDEAIISYEKALALDPNLADAWIGYGQVLGMSERVNEAVAAYGQASKLGADADLVGYLLAGLGVGSPPIASPKDYIIEQFDSFAENFDLKLVQELKYQVPIILSAAIKPFVYPSDPDVLDLGCGTGLMGVSLRPFVRTLTGIDLSSKMLKKAEQRGVYDHLKCCDIIEFLSTQEKNFDLAVAADVFVYFGDLLPIFQAVRRVIRDNGFFCISIEATEESDIVLRQTLRYAHSKSYIEQTARNNQFAVRYMDPITIRQEAGKNIDGYIAIMQCI